MKYDLSNYVIHRNFTAFVNRLAECEPCELVPALRIIGELLAPYVKAARREELVCMHGKILDKMEVTA